MSKKTLSNNFKLYIVILFSIVMIFSGCKKQIPKDFNVVLIVIDTLRSDHLPFYGYKKNTAPFMNKISKNSVLFKNAYSTSSWTAPATASILTSLHPVQHGVHMGMLAIKNAQKVDPNITLHKIPSEIETITETLKRVGFQTFGISDNININKTQGFTQGFDYFETHIDKQAKFIKKRILKWKKQITSAEKYFLYIHFNDPHAPYYQRKPWYKPENKHKDNIIAAYDSEISYVDYYIKSLFNEFAWDKNTLLIITADHGEGLWDHGLKGHGNSLFREEIQVPLIFYLPNGSRQGIVSQNVSPIDIVPTIKSLLQLPPSKTDAGISLLPLIYNPDQQLVNRNIFSQLKVTLSSKIPNKTRTVESRSIIFNDWHFINQMPNRYFLFSLMKDKREKKSTLNSNKKIGLELERKLNKFYSEVKKIKQVKIKQKLDDEQIKKLKSLGYIK